MGRIHSLKIGGSTYVIEPKYVKIYTKDELIDEGDCRFETSIAPLLMAGCGCSQLSNQDYGTIAGFPLITGIDKNNHSMCPQFNFDENCLYSENFAGNLNGTATNANNVNVTVTSTYANYPLILGPSTIVGGPVSTGNKSLYTNSANNIFYNPSTNDLTLNSGYIIMPTDDKKGIMPATNNYGQVGFSDRKFWKMHASTFVGNLSGNADAATKVNVTNKTSGMSYLAFLNDKTAGVRYTYSYSHAFMNNTTGELQIPHLRLKHTNGNYGSYLSFGDGQLAYINEGVNDRLIYSAKKHTIQATEFSEGIHLDGFVYFMGGVEPKTNNLQNLGSSSKKFKATYSTAFYGDLTGNVNGESNRTRLICVHSLDSVINNNICPLDANYEVPVLLAGCDCTSIYDPLQGGFWTYTPIMSDMGTNNPSNFLRYNFDNQTLKSVNFEGSLIGNATSATTATNATYINVTSSSTNNGTYRLLFTNGTGNRKAYTNSRVCVNPSTKTIIADQIRGFGNGSWSQDYEKATSYNGSISSASSWAPVCAVRTTGGVWSMGHIWPGDSQNYLTFSYVGDSVRATNGNVTLKLPVPKFNRLNFIPIGDQQFDGQPAVARIVTLSSSQYTNLTAKDPNTLYLII